MLNRYLFIVTILTVLVLRPCWSIHFKCSFPKAGGTMWSEEGVLEEESEQKTKCPVITPFSNITVLHPELSLYS